MNILAIETATEACSAALLYNNRIYTRFEHQPQQQARLILPMIDALLTEAGITLHELDTLAFGRGPGSFTGVRIAAAVTQGLAVAANLPVVPVSTLAAIAQRVYREHGHQHVLTALDARMQEVYWGVYSLDDNDVMQLHGAEIVTAPEQVPVPQSTHAQWVAAGSGWEVYKSRLSQACQPLLSTVIAIHWPDAVDILSLAHAQYIAQGGVSAEQAVPVYLRDNVAKPKANKQHS